MGLRYVFSGDGFPQRYHDLINLRACRLHCWISLPGGQIIDLSIRSSLKSSGVQIENTGVLVNENPFDQEDGLTHFPFVSSSDALAVFTPESVRI